MHVCNIVTTKSCLCMSIIQHCQASLTCLIEMCLVRCPVMAAISRVGMGLGTVGSYAGKPLPGHWPRNNFQFIKNQQETAHCPPQPELCLWGCRAGACIHNYQGGSTLHNTSLNAILSGTWVILQFVWIYCFNNLKFKSIYIYIVNLMM